MSEHLRSAEDVAQTHAVIGFQHVKQGAAQTIPEDVALCYSCGWMPLSEYTLHVADLIRAYASEVREAARAEALADLTSRASKDKSIQGLQRATICSWLSRQVEP